MNKLGAYQKRALNIENVKARREFLKQAVLLPHKVTKVVANALRGQRAFCALSLPSSKITALALNTYKDISRELFSSEADAHGDGFALLDAMRKAAFSSFEELRGRELEREAPSQNSPDGALSLQRIQQLEAQVVRQSKAYLDLYGKINALVKEPGFDYLSSLRLFQVLDSHQAMFAELVNPSTSRREMPAVVVSMAERT